MEVVAQAAIDVTAMDHDAKVRLADEVFLAQPNLFGSILVLPRMGVSIQDLEIALHILLVTFQAMKRSRHRWDPVSEDEQEACMQRLTAQLRFNERLPAELAANVVRQFCDNHAQRYLLAYVYGHLRKQDLLKVRTDAEKYLMLAVLNLVECIAHVGARRASR